MFETENRINKMSSYSFVSEESPAPNGKDVGDDADQFDMEV